MKFPVFSLLAGNFETETSSHVTAPSSGESRANQDFLSRYDGKGVDRIANTGVSPFIVSNSSAIATSHRATHPLNR